MLQIELTNVAPNFDIQFLGNRAPKFWTGVLFKLGWTSRGPRRVWPKCKPDGCMLRGCVSLAVLGVRVSNQRKG